MQKVQALLALVVFLSAGAASAEVIVYPTQQVQPAPAAPPPNDASQQAVSSMLEMLKNYQKTRPNGFLDPEEVEKHYGGMASGTSGFTPATDSGPFARTAQECGEAKQRECSPSNFGGRTMCGLAVAKMIACMAPSIGGTNGCNGSCGDGKDFVKCQNGQMEKCGYAKIENPNDPRCKQAGAVLSYTQSPTARGSIYGHVEFVCGDNKYCSVYKDTHDRPWPRSPADACWFPKSSGNAGGSR
jgi:hypothetical protein